MADASRIDLARSHVLRHRGWRRTAASVLLAGLAGLALGCSSAAPPLEQERAAADGAALAVADGGADAALSPTAGAVDLSAEFEAIRARHKLPALAGAAYRDGKLLGFGAAGVRRLGDQTAITVSDRWHLGSCTKAMTATLVGMLVHEGKLAFTDPIGKHLTEGPIHAGYATVTVEMLLQHLAGMGENFPDAQMNDMWTSAESGEAPEITRKRVVYALLKAQPIASVGTFEYSNAGYMAAGLIIERVAGKAWESTMRERLFGPLGMTRCGFGPAATAPASVDAPWGHAEESGKLKAVAPDVYGDNPAAMGPAGTVHCPLDDWAKFLKAHVDGRKGTSSLASKAIFERLHKPPAGGDYAAGWGIASRSWAGGEALTHSGSNTMNYVTTWVAPATGLVVVGASNAGTDAAGLAIDDGFGPLIERFAR